MNQENKLKEVKVNLVANNAKPKFVKTSAVTYERDGKEAIWEMVDSHDSVHVLVDNTETEELLFVKQVRIPVLVKNPRDGACIECAAGIVDKDIPLIEIAMEEVSEELGYEVQPMNIMKVKSYKSSLGTQGTNVTAFMCQVTEEDKISEGGGLPGEDIQIIRVPYEDVPSYIFAQENIDATTLFLVTSWMMAVMQENM